MQADLIGHWRIARQQLSFRSCCLVFHLGIALPRVVASSCPSWTKVRCGYARPCRTPFHSKNQSRITPQVRKILESFPEVTIVASEHGRDDGGTDPTGFFNAEFYVGLKPYSEWNGQFKNKNELIDAVQKKLDVFPGITFNYTQPAEDAVDEALTGLKSSLDVKIFGPDLATLEEKGRAIKNGDRTCAWHRSRHAGAGTWSAKSFNRGQSRKDGALRI